MIPHARIAVFEVLSEALAALPDFSWDVDDLALVVDTVIDTLAAAGTVRLDLRS